MLFLDLQDALTILQNPFRQLTFQGFSAIIKARTKGIRLTFFLCKLYIFPPLGISNFLSNKYAQGGFLMTNSSRLIRLPEVLEVVGVSQSTLYRKIKKDEFPKPIVLCWDSLSRPRLNVWREQSVLNWIHKFGGGQ